MFAGATKGVSDFDSRKPISWQMLPASQMLLVLRLSLLPPPPFGQQHWARPENKDIQYTGMTEPGQLYSYTWQYNRGGLCPVLLPHLPTWGSSACQGESPGRLRWTPSCCRPLTEDKTRPYTNQKSSTGTENWPQELEITLKNLPQKLQYDRGPMCECACVCLSAAKFQLPARKSAQKGWTMYTLTWQQSSLKNWEVTFLKKLLKSFPFSTIKNGMTAWIMKT